MFAAFAIVAVLLATTGLYGVMSYAVSQRTPEIAVRLALGAPVRAIAASVVGRSVALAAIGASLGLVGALALAQAMTSVLFGVTTTDPATYAGRGARWPWPPRSPRPGCRCGAPPTSTRFRACGESRGWGLGAGRATVAATKVRLSGEIAGPPSTSSATATRQRDRLARAPVPSPQPLARDALVIVLRAQAFEQLDRLGIRLHALHRAVGHVHRGLAAAIHAASRRRPSTTR